MDTPDNQGDRPYLKKHSVVFTAVKWTGIGVVMGAAAMLALSPLANFSVVRKIIGQEGSTFGEILKKGMIKIPLAAGLGAGTGALVRTESENDIKDRVRPYVEKIEGERNALASMVANSGAQKS